MLRVAFATSLFVIMPVAAHAQTDDARSTPAPATVPQASASVQNAQSSQPFAVVAGKSIDVRDYDTAWVVAQRQKFYHRRAPESEVAKLRREVGDQLINQVLFDAEAKRRGIEPDRGAIEKEIAGYEARYKDSPQWPKIRVNALPALRESLERRSVATKLEAQVRALPEPKESVIRAYYRDHADKFTEPAQMRLSLIMLGVAPSAAKQTWEKAFEEAAAIRARIERGARFEELARLHSSDPSAQRDGDLGFVHSGVLPGPVNEAVAKLEIGQVSEPMMVLEGIALVRLDARKPAQLHSFEHVKERATKLWERDESDRRWDAFVAQLRSKATIKIVDATRYPPLAATGAK